MAALSRRDVDSTDYSEYESSEDDLDIFTKARNSEVKRKRKEADFNSIFDKLKVEIYKSKKAERRCYLARSTVQTVMFACGIIPRLFVMYVIKLEEGISTQRQKSIQLLKLLLPVFSSLLTLILPLDGSIYMQLRFIAALVFTLLGIANFLLLAFHKRAFGITFTMPATVMNGLADFGFAILILVIKSKWPFKKRRRQ